MNNWKKSLENNILLSDDYINELKAIPESERRRMVEGDWSAYKEDKLVMAIKYDLSQQQRDFLGAIGWYFYGPRASGRTFLSCSAAIITALQNPNQWIEIWDHYHIEQHTKPYIINMTMTIVEKHNLQSKFEWEKFRLGIRIRYNPNGV